MKLIKGILPIVMISMLLTSFTVKNNFDKEANMNDDPRKELAHYPEAKEGMVRYVIFLDEKSNENDYKIELIPGKLMEVDCNNHFMMGGVEEKVLEGWGYNYYEFTTNGLTASTQMLCIDQKMEEKFISAKTILIRYNSKLPVVIYAPQGYDIKYRIWKAGEEKTSEQN